MISVIEIIYGFFRKMFKKSNKMQLKLVKFNSYTK